MPLAVAENGMLRMMADSGTTSTRQLTDRTTTAMIPHHPSKLVEALVTLAPTVTSVSAGLSAKALYPIVVTESGIGTAASAALAKASS